MLTAKLCTPHHTIGWGEGVVLDHGIVVHPLHKKDHYLVEGIFDHGLDTILDPYGNEMIPYHRVISIELERQNPAMIRARYTWHDPENICSVTLMGASDDETINAFYVAINGLMKYINNRKSNVY